MPVRKSRFWKAASASRRKRRQRLGDGAGVLLDLRLELDRGLGEIVALEGLVGGRRRNEGKSEQRGGKTGADEAKTWEISRMAGCRHLGVAEATLSSRHEGVEGMAAVPSAAVKATSRASVQLARQLSSDFT